MSDVTCQHIDIYRDPGNNIIILAAHALFEHSGIFTLFSQDKFMKRIITMTTLACIFSAPHIQAAGNGTVNFSGKLVNQTCNVSVNGGGNNATVTIPAVQSSTLTASGNTAGTTLFTIKIANCNTPSVNGSGSVKAFFEQGPNVDSNGRLINTLSEEAGGATNVALQLIDNMKKDIITIGSNAQATTNFVPNNNGYIVINNSNGTATLSYAVRYYAINTVTPGQVASAVTYSLIYY